MNVKEVLILDSAVEDLKLGRHFYEQQESGIGDYFWDSLLVDIESLIIFAGVHSQYSGYYRALSKRFPYSVYYTIKENTVYVVAVLPMKKDPIWINKRLSQSPQNSS
ncbi:type II toxin-antitoxin system RelE/ParE family toxin [Marinomonas agarivorans]|nr:type II toxin-antitoxin system RelE/ParE family toxin [Marinomonas agarivorans]